MLETIYQYLTVYIKKTKQKKYVRVKLFRNGTAQYAFTFKQLVDEADVAKLNLKAIFKTHTVTVQ